MGYFQVHKNSAFDELLQADPNAFLLLMLIARRAKRSNNHPSPFLNIGEALIGDYKACGIRTRKKYRTALKNLKKAGIVATKTTNKGTIVKLIKTNICDINEDQDDQQKGHPGATQGPAEGHPGATNNKYKKGKRGKGEEYTVNFESFWKMYPIKKEKKEAFKEWRKNPFLESAINTILSKLSDQIEFKRNVECTGGFCAQFPYLERYIKKEKWNDEMEDETNE